MAPRDNDGNPSCKKKNFPVRDDSDTDVTYILPFFLHKKHKVVKLVKSQIQKIRDECVLCPPQGPDSETNLAGEKAKAEGVDPCRGNVTGREMGSRLGMNGFESQTEQNRQNRCRRFFLCYLIIFLLVLLLLIFIVVWVSAGPLSNVMARTPIPPGSFVRTDNLCSLEKKYLLRWSKSEYFE